MERYDKDFYSFPANALWKGCFNGIHQQYETIGLALFLAFQALKSEEGR